MNRLFRLLFLFIWLSPLTSRAQSLFSWHQPAREYRAVWLTTYLGLDWPRTPARTPQEEAAQRLALCKILDAYAASGINTVLFQARMRGTTAYPSAFEPFDEVFTGRAGRAPAYDPLLYAVEECHKRGMEIHAWVVAFPVCRAATVKALGRETLPMKRPELCQKCGDQWFMDPGVPGTDDYLADICREMVEKYDLDGIHLDYLRYPEASHHFNDAKTFARYGQGQSRADWRRENVSRTARKISEVVRSVRPWVRVSASPVGKYSDLARFSSRGWNARDAVSQECQRWLEEGWFDALFPMMYFDGDHYYPFIADWQAGSSGRPVCPGLGIYLLSSSERDWPLRTVQRQMHTARRAGLGGYAFFRSKFFTDDVKGLYRWVRDEFNAPPPVAVPLRYAEPSDGESLRATPSGETWVLPTVPSPLTPAAWWLDSIPPSPPTRVYMECDGARIGIRWQAVEDNSYTSGTWHGGQMPVRYNVYRTDSLSPDLPRVLTLVAQAIPETSYTYTPARPLHRHACHFVSALDAFGNEGPLRHAEMK